MTQLTGSTTIYIYDGSMPHACSWGDFVQANSDGMEAGELAEIRAALEDLGVCYGGGGAAAEYELRLSPRQ